MKPFRYISLFTGILGFDIAAKRLGWELVAACEKEAFPQAVIRQRRPGALIYNNIKLMPGRKYRGYVDLICGGYPCQPMSNAGKQLGTADDRYLWPHMRRLISAIRPTWVVAENVPGHRRLGLDDVLSDLEGLEYTCRTHYIPAAAVGANHRRDRIWIVANTNNSGPAEKALQTGRQGLDELLYPDAIGQRHKIQIAGGIPAGQKPTICHDAGISPHPHGLWQPQPEGSQLDQQGRTGDGGKADDANTKGQRRLTRIVPIRVSAPKSATVGRSKDDGHANGQRRKKQRFGRKPGSESLAAWRPDQVRRLRAVKSRIRGMDDGLSEGMDGSQAWPVPPTVPLWRKIPNYQARIRACGNALHPEIAYLLFRPIAEVEKLEHAPAAEQKIITRSGPIILPRVEQLALFDLEGLR